LNRRFTQQNIFNEMILSDVNEADYSDENYIGNDLEIDD
jgi:hypothetical protein